MKRFEVQDILFAGFPSRTELLSLNLPSPSGSATKVNVWRNHNFESVQALMSPFLSFYSWPLEYNVSSYDDTLSFVDFNDADIELIWFDSSRLMNKITFPNVIEWLEDRFNQLRSKTKGPIIFASWFHDITHSNQIEALTKRLPAIYFANLKQLCEDEKVPLIDERTSGFSGTLLSSKAQIIAARALSCNWLPGSFLPPVKALALDLDNTLHEGILGEDGVEGVRLTDHHLELQKYLMHLRKTGIFLSLVSRNEKEDVEKLFHDRTDYPIKWDEFSVTEISWKDKAIAIQTIAEELRISTDSILFVDDNIGELASVSGQIKNIHTLYASKDASVTKRSIMNYPGLWRWKIQDDDAKRIQDLKANADRLSVSKISESVDEYFLNLGVTLTFKNNPLQQISRLADLCNKTNQFNLSLRRFNEVELVEKSKLSQSCITSVHLADRLSDSGVIAVIVVEKLDDTLEIQELCVSCRALGRHLENAIIFGSLQQMPIFRGCKKVNFSVAQGPRNQPAIRWLSEHLGSIEALLPGHYQLEAEQIYNYSKNFDNIKMLKDLNLNE